MNEAAKLYHVVEVEAFNWTTSAASMDVDYIDRPGGGVGWQVESAIRDGELVPLNMPYTIFEILVALVAIIGNAMVIYVFRHERKLRRRTNYYIVSLAIADLFVGLLGIPFAILAAVGLPTNLHACLFTISLLVVLCTISIFCLVAVSVDRYWAILHPMAYSRNVRTRTAIVIIAACWVAGILIGLLPLFGWHAPQHGNHTACLFVKVMSYDYLVFLYIITIVTPAILLIAFYAHIYRVIVRQLRQIVTMNPTGSSTANNNNNNSTPSPAIGVQRSNSTSTNIVSGLVQQISRRSSASQKSITPTNNPAPPPSRTQSPFCFRGAPAQQGGTMLRVLGAAQKREVKATQNLSVIVLFFMICWLPLYTVNCIKAFWDCEIDSALMLALIALSHVNSAVNPLLYAYHLRDFRAALKNLILRMMGRPVPRTTEVHRRISAASRMQSMREKRSFHPRIYIDSPVWLRQQVHTSKTEVVLNGSISSALRSVVRVASMPTDAGNTNEMMSQIAEVPSQAERESSRNTLNDQNNSLNRIVDLVRVNSNQQSFECYATDDENEEDEEGIRITVRTGVDQLTNFDCRRTNKRGSRNDQQSDDSLSISSSDDVFVTSSPELPLDKDSKGDQGGIPHHSTELPTFHQHNSIKDDERRFYDAYKKCSRGIVEGRRSRRGSSYSVDRGEKEDRVKSPNSEAFNISKCSSTGTISSEDLTEFRDRSASSVFIIENESVQLSPRHSKYDDEPTRIKNNKSHHRRRRRGNSSKDVLSKPSPLKVVTKLIFANNNNNHDGSPSSGGVSGKFSYMDMDDEKKIEARESIPVRTTKKHHSSSS